MVKGRVQNGLVRTIFVPDFMITLCSQQNRYEIFRSNGPIFRFPLCTNFPTNIKPLHENKILGILVFYEAEMLNVVLNEATPYFYYL